MPPRIVLQWRMDRPTRMPALNPSGNGHRGRRAGLGLLSVLLAACATAYGPSGLQPGAGVDEVLARMGPATARHALEDGRMRLEFARGPQGLHTYMLDFDSQGRLLRSEQVLTEQRFLELRPGMTAEEVRLRIGTPSSERALPRQRHRLWSYRYETPFCIWFQVSLDAEGRVAELGHNLDPRCEFDSGN